MVYYTVGYAGGKLADHAIVIDASRFTAFESWEREGTPSLDRLPREYAAALKSVYVNKPEGELGPEEQCLNRRVTGNAFWAIQRDLHNVLWGGGGTADNDVFSNLTKLFLAKIYDEQFTPTGEQYAFQIRYKDRHPESPSEVVERLNSKERRPDGTYVGILRRAEKAYLEMSDEEIGASQGLDTGKVSPGKIAYVVEQLQGISLTENENKDEGDILGQFFEGIVRSGFKQSKGQFFTHPNIVKFCIYGLKLDDLAEQKITGESALPYIVDPACGSGTFLIEAMKVVTRTVKQRNLQTRVHRRAQQLIGSWFPDLKENIWAKDFVYGAEISPDLALATKVNMVLHGDGNINIFVRDGLLGFPSYEISSKLSLMSKAKKKNAFPYAFPVNEQFDVLLTNPPFSVDLDNETKRGLATPFEFARNRNSENLFIERWYQLLKPGGRMAAVLPEAVFDTGENEYIRLFLCKYFHLKAVVSLPELAFKPWTPTRTALLFATKKTDEEVRRYDRLWREKYKDYRKLLKAPPIAHVLLGDRLLTAAMRICASLGQHPHLAESATGTMEVVRACLGELVQQEELTRSQRTRSESVLVEVAEWLDVDPDATWGRDACVEAVSALLKSFYDARHGVETGRDVLEHHWEEIVRLAKSNWWVFTEVAGQLDEEILYFEVANVGYKRTTKRERIAPNDLFAETNGEICPTDVETVLGQIRSRVDY
jgi:type I restriction enzyme M protein